MTAEIGRVLGGRYRLIAPIGMGASAQVYLADDVRLRRRVAVKMLHDALADDTEFLRRFRAEARAAAALSHPNVMAVYDWGDEDLPYIISEYLGGGSLRGLLDQGNLLTPSQALAVGLEATRALDYAHRRGFVHRDIKPANLLFGDDHRLRIADFGLARALAEAAWTEPQGAVLGTARYASPEQAKGETLSGKADVYSLALVLVEAVTGSVPFVADTTLGTLMARVDRNLEVPEELGPLAAIIARAGLADPEERIDARTLAAGLLRAAKALPRPGTLPLAGALPPAGEAIVDSDPTLHAPGVVPLAGSADTENDLTDDDLDLDPPHWVNQSAVPPEAADAGEDGSADEEPFFAEEPSGDEGDGPEDDPARGIVVGGEVDADASTGEVEVIDLREPPPGSSDGDSETEDEPSVSPVADPSWIDHEGDDSHDPVDRVVDPTAVVAVPSGSGVAAGGAPVPAYTPPDEVLEQLEADEQQHRRRRWPWVVLAAVVLAAGGGVAAATVMDREPEAPVRTVTLPVPVLTDRAEDQVVAMITSSGWEVGDIERTRQDGTLRGQVLEMDPAAGTRLVSGSIINLVVSDGQTFAPVPTELAAMTWDEASAALGEAGFRAAQAATAHHEEVAAGSVIAVVEGTPEELEKGSEVPLVVSDGPRPRTVPAGLQGSTESAAREALDAEGLEVAVNRQFHDDIPEGQVVSVLPGTGTTLARGETVTIEVSRGPELRAIPSVAGASTISEAVAILRNAGFRDGDLSGPASGSPRGTRPAAGTMARPGSSVDIIMG